MYLGLETLVVAKHGCDSYTFFSGGKYWKCQQQHQLQIPGMYGWEKKEKKILLLQKCITSKRLKF